MPPERPKGIAGLGVRQWTCSACGVVHDRDVNAALNILARHGYVSQVAGADAVQVGDTKIGAKSLNQPELKP